MLNGDKKEEIIYKKKFNDIGLNTIYFIVEENLKIWVFWEMCKNVRTSTKSEKNIIIFIKIKYLAKYKIKLINI